MGTRTFVTPIKKSSQKLTFLDQVDLPFVLTLILLLGIGLIMLYSASWDFSYKVFGSNSYMFTRQVGFMLLGLVLMAVLSKIDYHYYPKVALIFMIVTLGLLLLVLVLNQVRWGAARTLFNGSYQPSEMAKLAIVVYLAVWLYSKRDSLQDTSLGLVPLGIILGLLGAMILKQPDLSAAFTVVILGVVMFFLAGGEWKQIFILVAVTVLVGVVVMKLNSTGSNRLADYVAGLQDPAQSSYHVSRALEAIVNGGWFGVGLGNANTKFTGLPVPPTDSIFAVVAEEFGIFGSLIVLCLYAVFIWRGLRIAHKAPDMLGSLLAGGLIIWIGMEAMINMGVLVGLLPFAGNALPLMSSGGSSLVMTLMAIGIILNVSSQSYKKQPSTVSEDERRNYSASIDLRRRNGRRGLSRPNRSQRTIR